VPAASNRPRVAMGLVLAIFAAFLLPLRALAQMKPAIRTFPVGPAHNEAPGATTCPNQSGILDSISVPVGMPITLALVIPNPAPSGGAQFQVGSADPSIAAAGDPRQSFLPIVTIPAGQTQSNSFQVFGIKVGATTLDTTPLTAGFSPGSEPLGAWDVNPQAGANGSKFLDANPPANTCRASGSPNLSTDPNVLSACGQTVKAAATDGVTQLLMRMVSGLSGTACYQIVTSGSEEGSVSTAVTSTQSVGSSNYAFSFYQTPNFFGDTSDTRQVMVQFSFTPNLGFGNTSNFTVPLTLVRPPLLLVHGLWSSRKAWSSFWMRSPGSAYVTFAGDYEPTNAASFSTNSPRVQGFVASTLNQARQASIAATQVDVIAHSMGGILTRLYANNASMFMRPDNYNKGDIHRIVTLDTPHGGSSFGNLLVVLHSQDPADLETTVQGLTHGSVVNGAVCDLAENSPGLEPLTSATNVMSQVVTATHGPIGSFWNGVGPLHLGSFQAALTKTKCLKRNLLFQCIESVPVFDQTTVKAYYFTHPNDAIIALCAQQGGLGGACTLAGPDSPSPGSFNFPDLIHFGADIFFFQAVAGVTNSSEVSTAVFPLLDGPDSGFATSIPGMASNGTGLPITVAGRGATLDGPAYTSQCITGAPPPMKTNVSSLLGELEQTKVAMNTPVAQPATGDSRVTITSPANGQVFAPGASVTVNVSIASGLSANDVSVLIPLLGSQEGVNYNGATYQVTFTIPNTVAGPFQLTPIITDSGNNTIVGVATTIAVRPTTPPATITLSQSNYVLTTVGATERIDVIGNYSGGIQRDLSSSAAGTTYKSSNTSVITVDSEGHVTAAGFGTASVTVANDGVTAFATFTVEDPSHPLAPQDATSQVNIVRLGFRVDRNTGFFDQTVQLSTKSFPVIGPLYAVLTGLPAGVTLVGAGTTENITPVGSPYFTLTLPNGVSLQPGSSQMVVLQFLNPERTQIAYTPKLYRSSTTP
jgi:pimeloyl-ACP methyl ester carboxylesterase